MWAKSFVGMVRVDIDPVKILIRKSRQDLVRFAFVELNARVLPERREQRRKIEIDEVEAIRVACGKDVLRELAFVGSNFSNPATPRKRRDELIPGRTHPAILKQPCGQRRGRHASNQDVPCEPERTPDPGGKIFAKLER
jgi:hypothetical protein